MAYELKVTLSCECGCSITGDLNDSRFQTNYMNPQVGRCPQCARSFMRKPAPPLVITPVGEGKAPVYPTLADIAAFVDAAVEKQFKEFVFDGTTKPNTKKKAK